MSIVVTGGSDADIPPNMVAYGLSWMVGAGDGVGNIRANKEKVLLQCVQYGSATRGVSLVSSEKKSRFVSLALVGMKPVSIIYIDSVFLL